MKSPEFTVKSMVANLYEHGALHGTIVFKRKKLAREGPKYKIYLPRGYNHIFSKLYECKCATEFLILIPDLPATTNLPAELIFTRIIRLPLRKIAREGRNYKIYLPRRLNDLWRFLYSNNVTVTVVMVSEFCEQRC